MALKGQEKYEELLAERANLFKAKVVAEQDEAEGEDEDDENEMEEGDELESGWEEASEGASDFED